MGKFDYRLPINKHFLNGTPTAWLGTAAASKRVSVKTTSEKIAIQGFANYTI
jgi:hypothetical protein